jgi:GTP cyclohydrolase II
MNTTITLPTAHGNFLVSHFSSEGQEALLIRTEEISDKPFLRIHSSCVFSEALHSNDCDCALQLDASLKHIGQHGGLVIYLYQEGRGIGLSDKIKAISIEQLEGLDTAAAFAKLGHHHDPRKYHAATQILKNLHINQVIVATNNPEKIAAIEAAGIVVTERVTLEIPSTLIIREYIDKKKLALSHI